MLPGMFKPWPLLSVVPRLEADKADGALIPAIAFPEMDATEGVREPGMSGVTVIVSPLLALMKDQVDALRLRGIPADCIDSTKTWDEMQVVHSGLRKGQLRLVYCAPERLNNEGFIESIKSVPGGIRLLAVDEAHCISEVVLLSARPSRAR